MATQHRAACRDGLLPRASDLPLRRRHSMDEDLYYHHVMGTPPQTPFQPLSYRPDSTEHVGLPRTEQLPQHARDAKRGGLGESTSVVADQSPRHNAQLPGDALLGYQTSVSIEGVFAKKHELEHTTKRAEDRHWHMVFVTLNGTALNIHGVKKNWGWGKTRDGPTICPENPPWVKKAKLEKSYSLLHADAGIAADYVKRRYVIRVRAETDQFLLSCIELSTFVNWLQCLFAAIDVAAPLEDRDFPRDMSIPGIQRVRWFQGHSPAPPGFAAPTSAVEDYNEPELSESPDAPGQPSRVSSQVIGSRALDTSPPRTCDQQPSLRPESFASSSSHAATERQRPATATSGTLPLPPARHHPVRRMSFTDYPNPSIDPHTGKWFPDCEWSSAHDLLYAKLCYSNLLFRSPRKSSYIINKRKQWTVDWRTGRMVRVLPPAYDDGEEDDLSLGKSCTPKTPAYDRRSHGFEFEVSFPASALPFFTNTKLLEIFF